MGFQSKKFKKWQREIFKCSVRKNSAQKISTMEQAKEQHFEKQELHSHFRSLISLIIGLLTGFSMALIFMTCMPAEESSYVMLNRWKSFYEVSETDIDTPEKASFLDKPIPIHSNPNEDSTLAKKLYNETRVLCWIMTNPKNHKWKARHVKRTWGKRCNKLLIMSSKHDRELGTIALNVSEGRNNLWAKTKAAFKYIYENHYDDADWFLKADDDTYVIVENLRYMLYPYSPQTAIHFGCKFGVFVKGGYMSGGAGYVLSKEALRRFVEIALPNGNLCRQSNGGAEDLNMGSCLASVKVIAGDSRDIHGHSRFFALPPAFHLTPHWKNFGFWYWQYIYYKSEKAGFQFCSDYAVSFHYVQPDQMYVLDYYIYHLSPFGIVKKAGELPTRLQIGETKLKKV